MPYEMVVDRDQRRVITTWSGPISDQELLDRQAMLLVDEELIACDGIIDFRGVTSVNVSSECIQLLAERNRAHREAAARQADGMPPQDSLLALVAEGDLAYGLVRMFTAYHEFSRVNPNRVEIFRTLDEGLAWIESEHP